MVDGDLVDQPVYVIVNGWNRNIIPWWLLIPQGVSAAIRRRAGLAPFRELRKLGPIPLGGAVETGAGKLPFRAIIHVAGISMFWRSSERSIPASVRSAMALARGRYNSIAIPLIGAGTGGIREEKVLGWMRADQATHPRYRLRATSGREHGPRDRRGRPRPRPRGPVKGHSADGSPMMDGIEGLTARPLGVHPGSVVCSRSVAAKMPDPTRPIGWRLPSALRSHDGRGGTALRALATALALAASACGGSPVAAGDADPDANADASADSTTPSDASDDGGRPDDAGTDVALPPPTCGNGIVDPGEECDDGNRMDGDGCDWSCLDGEGTRPWPTPPDPDVEGFEDGDELEPLDGGPSGLHGTNMAVVWADSVYATIVAAAVGADGELGAAFLSFGTDGGVVNEWRFLDEVRPQGYMDLVWNGDGYGLAWCGDAGGIWFVELDELGKPLYPPFHPVPVAEPCDPTLDWGDGRYGLFWTVRAPDESRGGTSLDFVALGPGGVTETAVVRVVENPDGGVYGPDASTDGAHHLVGFANHTSLCGGRSLAGCTSAVAVTGDGSALRAPAVIAANGRSAPDTAWSGDRFAVLVDAMGPRDGAHLAFFSPTGELLAAPVPVVIPGFGTVRGVTTGTALGWGRGGWAVAYLDNSRYLIEPESGIIRLDSAGRFVEVVPAGMSGCMHVDGYPGRSLDMAFDGDGFGLLCFGGDTIRFGRFVLSP